MTDVDKYILWAGSAIVFITLAVTFFMNSLNFYVILLFAVGAILVLGILSRYSECGNKEDERLKKITAFSLMNSWVTGVTLLSTVLFLSYFNWLGPLSAIQAMSLTIAIMLLMFYCWYAYYSLKRDVE